MHVRSRHREDPAVTVVDDAIVDGCALAWPDGGLDVLPLVDEQDREHPAFVCFQAPGLRPDAIHRGGAHAAGRNDVGSALP